MSYKILTKELEIEFSEGTNIRNAIEESRLLANENNVKIKFDFNSVTIILSPNSERTITSIENEYLKKLTLTKVIEA